MRYILQTHCVFIETSEKLGVGQCPVMHTCVFKVHSQTITSKSIDIKGTEAHWSSKRIDILTKFGKDDLYNK